MPTWPGFIGPSYTSYSRLVECQETINWFTEFVESGAGKNPKALYRSPGLKNFYPTLNVGGKVRGFSAVNQNCFAVVGSHLVQLDAYGNFNDLSAANNIFILDNGLPVQMAQSPTQLMIVGGNQGFYLDIATGVLQPITAAGFPTGTAIGCTFQDGFFVVIQANSQQFGVSGILDASSWDALDVSEAESRPDFILSVVSRGEELWMGGSDTWQPFYAGGGLFPFTSNQSGVVSIGVQAPAATSLFNRTILFVGSGQAMHAAAYAMDAYEPARISTHAVEQDWEKYVTTADAIGSVFQIQGHNFWQVSFPTAGVTWHYDLITKDWTKAAYFNTSTGLLEQHRADCFVHAFDRILAGDRSNGKIYDVSMAYLDDDGSIIQRLRRAPHLCDTGNDFRSFTQFQLNGNAGIGLNVASTAQYYNPQALLRWSDDGSETWSPYRTLLLGPMGNYKVRPRTMMLGRARDRVFELLCADPVDYAFAAAYVDYY